MNSIIQLLNRHIFHQLLAVLLALTTALSAIGGTTTPPTAPVLLVIDMQTGYIGDKDSPLVKAVSEEISTAISGNWTIVVLSLKSPNRDFGPTHPTLLQKLKGYARVAHCQKSEMDGSLEAITAVRQFGSVPSTWRICGVYWGQCVSFTVRGLLARLPKHVTINVIFDATDAPHSYSSWPNFPTADNIKVIRGTKKSTIPAGNPRQQ